MTIKEAARKLVERLDEVHGDQRYVSVWQMYALHGMRYGGPFYDDELNELKSALGITKAE